MSITAEFINLPLNQLESDPEQPRQDTGPRSFHNRLYRSLDDIGLQNPLIVKKVAENKYRIIDGHRRYKCVKELKWKTVPCRVYGELPRGEFERVRFEAQTNRREWKPLERADALEQVKTKKKLTSNREVAGLLNVSESTVTASLAIRSQSLNHIRLMEKYDLQESYQTALRRLLPKMNRMGDLEVNDILQILVDKVQRKVIKKSKDLGKLKKIFARATANEKVILEFLKNPDATIEALDHETAQSSVALKIEQLLQELAEIRSKDKNFSSAEKIGALELERLLHLMNTK